MVACAARRLRSLGDVKSLVPSHDDQKIPHCILFAFIQSDKRDLDFAERVLNHPLPLVDKLFSM